MGSIVWVVASTGEAVAVVEVVAVARGEFASNGGLTSGTAAADDAATSANMVWKAAAALPAGCTGLVFSTGLQQCMQSAALACKRMVLMLPHVVEHPGNLPD